MDEIDLLSGVLDKTAKVIEAVDDDQARLPTPCDDFDVAALVDHIVGWIQVFAAAANGRTYDDDVSTFHCGDDPAGQFRAAATSLVDGWRARGLDGQLRFKDSEIPAEMAFDMTVMEYLAHGWDLARATGQPIPYREDEAQETLERAEATLPPEYRGEAMPFGPIVPVADDASAVDRLVAFLGRQP